MLYFKTISAYMEAIKECTINGLDFEGNQSADNTYTIEILGRKHWKCH